MLQSQIEISIPDTHKIRKSFHFGFENMSHCVVFIGLHQHGTCFSYNKNKIYIIKRYIDIEIVFIFVDSFEVNNLSLHKLPLQLQIVAFVLPISILLQLFADLPLPQPNPRTEIKKTSIRSLPYST